MNLTRTQPYQRPAALKGSVQSALLCLGLSRQVIYRDPNRCRTRRPQHGVSESFWALPAARLWELLEAACRNFRRLIRRHHPDRGGCAKRAAQLIAAWNLVKRHFARRGFELG
jgi:hypothetical protein